MAHFAVDVCTCIYTGKNASSFRWDRYLQQCGGQAAPNSAFTSVQKKWTDDENYSLKIKFFRAQQSS